MYCGLFQVDSGNSWEAKQNFPILQNQLDK